MVRINVGRVKSGLARKGMIPDVAAKEAGISQNKFKRILSDGKCDPISLGRIARILGLQAWELVDK